MSNQWFRMYHEFATYPRVQMLSEKDQRRFVMLLCLCCCDEDGDVASRDSGVALQDAEVVFQLRISEQEWAETKQVLESEKLIGANNKPTQILGWLP